MTLLQKYRHLLPFVFIALSSCGNTGKPISDGSIRGPVITGSKNSGAYITMVATDASISSSALYYYDFSSGAISRVSSAEGRDPIVIWSPSIKSVVLIVRSTKTFRTMKIQEGNPVDLKSGTLSELDTGDPSQWLEIDGGSYLLANSRERTLQTFDASLGYLSTPLNVASLSLPALAPAFNPTLVAGSSSTAWVTSGGVDFSGVTPESKSAATLVKLNRASDAWSLVDLNPNDVGVQGLPLTASNPAYAQVNSDGTSVRVFGLCKEGYGSACKAGADEINTKTGTKTELSGFANSGYEHYSWVIAGASDDIVYAHVTKTKLQRTMIIRANLKTGEIKEIYTFPETTLSLLMYDKDADRLFIGEKLNHAGFLSVFQSESLESKFSTNDLPWQGAFVPTL
ncbi:MAG: hypothetical protein NTV34_05820 [Proteobacteria bacterium]|nr:hypothetical protein [Pseudomonadota bacterium]